MKKLKLIILMALLASPAYGVTIFGGLDPQNVEAVNKLPNGGFENGTQDWTSSGSATFSTVTSGANLAVGSRTASWEPNAASDALTSDQYDIDIGHQNQTCVATFVYKGAGAFISAQVIDGSSAVLGSVDLSNVAQFTRKTVLFTGPSSGTIAFRLFSVADSILTYIDDIYIGCRGQDAAINPIVFEQTDTVTGFGGATGTITHDINVPIENQDWSAVVTTGAASLQLDPSVFITDKTTTSIDYDFSGLTGTDTVTVRLANTGFSANVLPTVTYDSGVLTAAPSFPVAHGLPSRPKHVVVLTEGQSIADKWDMRFDLCSADDDEIDCDLSSLTIGASNNVQIIASMVPAGTAIAEATENSSGIVSIGAQRFAGNKTFVGGLNTEGLLTVEDSMVIQKASVTIISGTITPTSTYHAVDTEASAASDDLDTITAGTSGQILVLRAFANARDVVVKNGTGNIDIGSDFTLDESEDKLVLIYDATESAWLQLSRNDFSEANASFNDTTCDWLAATTAVLTCELDAVQKGRVVAVHGQVSVAASGTTDDIIEFGNGAVPSPGYDAHNVVHAQSDGVYNVRVNTNGNLLLYSRDPTDLSAGQIFSNSDNVEFTITYLVP